MMQASYCMYHFVRFPLVDAFACTATHCSDSTHCNTLQHTATHCNTLQHTAIHCNTPFLLRMQLHALQHTAQTQQTVIHCNSLQYTAIHCNTLQHTATHCNTLQPTATHLLWMHSHALQRTAIDKTLQRTATHLLWKHSHVQMCCSVFQWNAAPSARSTALFPR